MALGGGMSRERIGVAEQLKPLPAFHLHRFLWTCKCVTCHVLSLADYTDSDALQENTHTHTHSSYPVFSHVTFLITGMYLFGVCDCMIIQMSSH